MDYTYLDEPERNGEVQIFRQYRRKVNVARQARAEVLARTDGRASAGDLDAAIWAHAATVRRRRFPTAEARTELG
jgi:ATP-dependent 26S proteasome regulatory subunit